MTMDEILAALAYCEGTFPCAAMEEAMARREEITPRLLEVLEQSAADLPRIATEESYWGHIFAMFLLGYFREPRAYPLLVRFFTGDQTLVRQATDDIITESLPRLLASTCDGDITPIQRMVEDPTLDEYTRGAALDALLVLVVEGSLERDAVIAYLRELFHGKLEREPGHIWGALVNICCDLYPAELLPEIEQAFAEDLVDRYLVGPESVTDSLDEGKDGALAYAARNHHHHYLRDPITELSRWYCFQPESRRTYPAPQAPVQPPAPVHLGPKPGRNDPCPCGSGQKYKRCCMQKRG